MYELTLLGVPISSPAPRIQLMAYTNGRQSLISSYLSVGERGVLNPYS
jgi:hypothetical protein